MGSRSTSTHANGFTLIEVIITIGLIGMIASLGMLLSFDFYRTYAFQSEQSIVLSVLQKARNQALSNINQKPHGVHFDSDKYVIFEGSTYSSSDPKNIVVNAQPTVSASSTASEVLFNQLSGDATTATVTLTSNGRTKTITINAQGQIDAP